MRGGRMGFRVDVIVAVVVASLSSPVVLSLVAAIRRAWMTRREVMDDAQRWRLLAMAWEAEAWATRRAAVKAGVDVADLPSTSSMPAPTSGFDERR